MSAAQRSGEERSRAGSTSRSATQAAASRSVHPCRRVPAHTALLLPSLQLPPPAHLPPNAGVLLGPIAGILLADYYWVRRRRLDLDALYSTYPSAPYHYHGGWNPAALAALAAGAAPTLPGLLHVLPGTPAPRLCLHLYHAAWFVGFAVGGAVYALLMRRHYRLQPQEALVGRAA